MLLHCAPILADFGVAIDWPPVGKHLHTKERNRSYLPTISYGFVVQLEGLGRGECEYEYPSEEEVVTLSRFVLCRGF